MGKHRPNHNFKRRLKLIEKQTGKPWSPGNPKKWNDTQAWGQSPQSKGTWRSSRADKTKKFSRQNGRAANQKVDKAEKKREKKRIYRKAKKAQAKLRRQQELSKTGDAPAAERPKLGVSLKNDARRKMKRSKGEAQADVQTCTDAESAGFVSLADMGLSTAAVTKKKRKIVKKRKRGTSDIGSQTIKTSRAAKKRAVGTAEDRHVALEDASLATGALPRSRPKKVAKRQNFRNVLLEEAMRREKLSGKTDKISGELHGGRKKMKTKTKRVKGTAKSSKNVASVGFVLRNASGRPLSKKERLQAKLGIQKRIRQKAYVICPGSVTDRYARQQLTGNERRLLASGGLSWRWLREPFDPERLPGASRHKPDSRAHQVKLDKHLQHLPEPAARKLCWLDECLEAYACWPPCTARAALAVRLRKKGALRKQCERHFADVIEPLLEAPPATKANTTDHSGEGAGLQNSLLLEARRLCMACSDAWRSLAVDGLVRLEGSGNDVRSDWWQMLCCAMSADLTPRCKGPRGAWLRALQRAMFARLCPEPTGEARQRMLQAAVEAAGKDVVERMAEAQQLPLVLLPLGTFTFWQVLLLVAAAHWLGTGSTVLRRTAAGPPEVVWRSPTCEHPSAIGKAVKASP